MNTNSKDVVKNVESNNVESTSNEQRRTNKPIVISRRRLLRAGVAGIPVVLTMAGIAPGQFGKGISAASGLDYDGMHTIDRFKDIHGDVLRDNLIYSDKDGFIYRNNGGYYQTDLKSLAGTTENSETSYTVSTSSWTQTAGTQNDPEVPAGSNLTFDISFDEGVVTIPARLNKNGCYYTVVDPSEFKSDKVSVGLSSLSSSSGYTITSDVPTISEVTISLDSTTWPTDTSDGIDWRLVPESEVSKSVTVTFKATVTVNLDTKSQLDDSDISYTSDVTLNCTLKLTMPKPAVTFDHSMDWNH